jgi:regulator of replication initiation timing
MQMATSAAQVGKDNAVVVQALERVTRLVETLNYAASQFTSREAQMESLVRENEAARLENRNLLAKLQQYDAANRSMLQALQHDRAQLHSTATTLQWYQNVFGHQAHDKAQTTIAAAPLTRGRANEVPEVQARDEGSAREEQADMTSMMETRNG